MTYNVFGGTLSLTQSINRSVHESAWLADKEINGWSGYSASFRNSVARQKKRQPLRMYVPYVFYFQKHIHISHCNNRQHEQSMRSEGQTGVKHLRLPLKHIKHIKLGRKINGAV